MDFKEQQMSAGQGAPDHGPGLDPTAAALADPVRPPAQRLTRRDLVRAGDRIAKRAEAMGLNRWFWGEGIVLDGLLRWAEARGKKPPKFVAGFVDSHLAQGIRPDHVNSLAPGAAAVRIGRTEVAPILLDWLAQPGAVTRAENGALEHWPGGLWAGTVQMAGSFLLQWARTTGEVTWLLRTGRQWLAHAEILQDRSGLMVHGSHQGEPIGCHWGRANAWMALAGCDFLETARQFQGAELDPSERQELDRLATVVGDDLTDQLVALVRHQPSHGLWEVLVDGHPETAGIIETSATAGIAAALFRASRLGLGDRFAVAARRAMHGLHSYVEDDGTLSLTSAGTVLQLIPFGYSVIRNDHIQPWGQGLALHAYAEALSDLAE